MLFFPEWDFTYIALSLSIYIIFLSILFLVRIKEKKDGPYADTPIIVLTANAVAGDIEKLSAYRLPEKAAGRFEELKAAVTQLDQKLTSEIIADMR